MFSGVEKGRIGNEWVKFENNASVTGSRNMRNRKWYIGNVQLHFRLIFHIKFLNKGIIKEKVRN